MNHIFSVIGLMFLIFLALGCSSGEDPPDEAAPSILTDTQVEAPADIEAAAEAPDVLPVADGVVLAPLSTAEVEALADQTRLEILTVLEGTQRVAIPARFRGVRDFGFGFPVYECELMSASVEQMGGIASGMSGSPVGPPGRIMGALAYGDNFSTAPTRFWVTAIDAMASMRAHQTFDEALAEHLGAAPSGLARAAYAPVKIPLMVSGIKPHRLEHLAAWLKKRRFEAVELVGAVGGAPGVPGLDRDLLAGDMIGVAVSTGDVVNSIGYGTVTEVYADNTFIAFGHPFSAHGSGKTSLPVYRAVVNGLVGNLESTYKSVSATGDVIGMVTKDLIPGIVGELGVVPERINFDLTYYRDRHVIEKNHQVAYGEEAFIAAIAALTFDAIRLETSPSTVDVTLTLHFKETDETYTETFLKASEDTFLEIWEETERILFAFTDPFSNTVEKATLTAVEMTITESPQIKLATLHEVSVPEPLVRGETMTVTLVLLPHWTAVENGERTIEKQVSLRVPDAFEDDLAWVSVIAKDPDDFLWDSDFDFDLDFDFEDQRPETLDELITHLTDTQADEPGKVTVVFSEDAVYPSDYIDPDAPQNEIVLEGFIVTGSEQILVSVE